MVIFAGGKFREKCCQDLSGGGNFRDTSHISLIKSYGFLFSRGGNFRKEDNIAKNTKITPTRKFPCLQYMIIETICNSQIQYDMLIKHYAPSATTNTDGKTTYSTKVTEKVIRSFVLVCTYMCVPRYEVLNSHISKSNGECYSGWQTGKQDMSMKHSSPQEVTK